MLRRTEKLFDCSHVPKSCFNAYPLSSFEYCSLVWMSSAGSNLGLLDKIVRSAAESRVRASFVVWVTERREVPCVCSISFSTG